MKRTAFSLVELSIVLVILGLLVGGVLAGQSLIRASELRSVSVDFARYHTAVLAFRDKYMALPGDMANATNFWVSTTNGSGNGLIANSETGPAWQQLAYAGLIPGAYSGIVGGTNTMQPGIDVPASKISGAGFGLRSGNSYNGKSGNQLEAGTPRPSVSQLSGAVFTTEDAWNIDKKMDDGVANSGAVRGHGNFDGIECNNSAYNAVPGNDYLIGLSGTRCYLKYYYGI